MPFRPLAVFAGCVLVCGLLASPASAEPDPQPVAADAPGANPAPPPDGRVVSAPSTTITTPDGWVLTMSARDEIQRPITPLTTAVSSREYEVGGVYVGSVQSPEGGDNPHGVLEVGYQIGCGIDMSTSQGVTLAGTAGLTPSLGLGGIDVVTPFPDGLNPIILAPFAGSIALGLKPGIVNIIPVTKKEFRGKAPWVMISNFHVKIDGCVGQSFIRSYAFLTRSTDASDAILAYYGTITMV